MKFCVTFNLTDYELLQSLGNGSCSIIKLARHKTSRKLFAIKIISKHLIQEFKFHDHIHNEI